MAEGQDRRRGGVSPSYDPLSTDIIRSSVDSRVPGGVLVVDPNVRFGLLLKGFLETRGWGASGSQMAGTLRDWHRLRPDVVVTELDGEDLDGFESSRRCGAAIPTCLWSLCTRLAGAANWSPADRRALGVEAVLVRPLQFVHLHSTLEAVLAAEPLAPLDESPVSTGEDPAGSCLLHHQSRRGQPKVDSAR